MMCMVAQHSTGNIKPLPMDVCTYVTRYVKMSQMSPNALLSYGQFNVENIFKMYFFYFIYYYFLRSIFAWLTFRTLTFS